MGRMYTIDFGPTAITVAADIVEIVPADDKPVIVHGFEIFQTTDLGDVAEEIIGLVWVRGNATSGSGGATPTPIPINASDAAAGLTAEALNTTAASTGSPVNGQRHGWNVRIPTQVIYTPETRPVISQGGTRLCLRMAAAPADSITISGCVTVEELG
jgi:hypothetical protein